MGRIEFISRDVKERKGSQGKKNPRRFFLNQLITGHGTIGTHQARLSPFCQCGHPAEDRQHYLPVPLFGTALDSSTSIQPQLHLHEPYILKPQVQDGCN
ncbi:hypothetical protein CEXT_469171 [Caerostris extrusa]|uniref:Uncharacterized protein n=1 Tax=Caerostris extrusa TaxID=172846 RepID=A0AAV4R3C3_CAEEX|nr:hypothetical protein CEXT_469171 [Caerostris extrusa]